MRLYTLMLMAGDGSVTNPRHATSVFPSIDQWALLVRDAFACRDRNGNVVQGRAAVMPSVWTLEADYGIVGAVSIDLDETVMAQALAKFGYADATAVVGSSIDALRTQAQARRIEAVQALPQAARTALANATVADIRAWLVAQTLGANVAAFRDWLVDAIDDRSVTSLPPFLLRPDTTDPEALNWSAVAAFADFLDTATATQKVVARLCEIGFLTVFINKSA